MLIVKLVAAGFGLAASAMWAQSVRVELPTSFYDNETKWLAAMQKMARYNFIAAGLAAIAAIISIFT